MRTVGRAHTALVRHTKVGRRFRGGEVLLLTHTGRRSGARHTAPLIFLRDGGSYLVAASNGGVDHEPQWWLNLQASPFAEIEVDGVRKAVRAEALPDAERDAAWERFRQVGAYYDGYQAGVRRRIAVVRLRPIR
ncbi:nitroreductase/quinone reductase family protein [Pseudonocardia sp. RS010]|uniref:nitroreductase/quinone reductase family protein n=1 Tax=Pseudonocardia sp. RS010 TaxID=3385979 RepID=UPI00399F950F